MDYTFDSCDNTDWTHIDYHIQHNIIEYLGLDSRNDDEDVEDFITLNFSTQMKLEWMNLMYQGIINLPDSLDRDHDDDDDQEVENINNILQIPNLSGDQIDDGGLADDRVAIWSSDGDDHRKMAGRSLFCDYNEYLQETEFFSSPLESILGRVWTLDDSIRVLSRMDQEIRKETGREYESRLSRAINEDIEYLRAYGALRLDLSDGDHNWGILFLEIFQRLEILVQWDRSSAELTSSAAAAAEAEGEECDEILCIVCLDELYQENKTIAMLGCGHEYHVDCMEKWLKRQNFGPLCRCDQVQPEVSDDDERENQETN